MRTSVGKRIVITGVGPLCSTGKGRDEFFENSLAQKSGLSVIDKYVFGKYSREFFTHKIPKFDISAFGLDKDVLEEMRIWKEGDEVLDLSYMIAASSLALEDSGIDFRDRDDVGMVLTHENPGVEQFCSHVIKTTYSLLEKNIPRDQQKYFTYLASTFNKQVNDLQTFMFIFFCAKFFQLHGYSLFVNNSCASGLYAIEAASQMIKTGRNQAVLVASSEHPAIYKYLWFDRLNLLAGDGLIRPYSLERQGFTCGEAGAAILLEDFDSAKKRNAHIYGEYVGGGFFLESWKVTLPKVTGENYYRKAILHALEEAGVSFSDIDLICAHGLGSPLIDAFEARAFSEIFGSKAKQPLVTSFKPLFGHTLGSCALLESILLLLCLEKDIAIPIMNSDRIDPDLKVNAATQVEKKRLNYVLKSVWGFGGYNAAAIFKKVK